MTYSFPLNINEHQKANENDSNSSIVVYVGDFGYRRRRSWWWLYGPWSLYNEHGIYMYGVTAESMCECNDICNANANAVVLQNAKGTKAMPMLLQQESRPSQVHQLSQRQRLCYHLWHNISNLHLASYYFNVKTTSLIFE